MGAGDGGHGVDYDGKADIKSYKSEDNVDNHMPQKGLGAGMYGEEDNAQHESGKLELVHTFARAQNPTARGVTPALGWDTELNHYDFTNDTMGEENSA